MYIVNPIYKIHSMSVMMKCLLIIAVFYSNILISSASFLYQYVEGSLADSWHFKYYIASQNFKGIILYCVDSGNRFLLMEIAFEHEQKVVKISHNSGNIRIKLKELCGCDPCDNTMMNIDLQSNISISCNNRDIQTMNKIISKIQIRDNPYPMPMVIVNTTRIICIKMGNVGPYRSIDGSIVSPRRNQLIGCLYTFDYNDRRIALLREGDKMKLHCPKMCFYNICNGGLCQQITMDNVSCDCSNVPLNGPYCNRGLKSYISGESKSYSISNFESPMYLKVTWKSSIKKHYCLMEIINKNKNVIISTDGTRNVIRDLNFFLIYITRSKLTLNINNVISTKEFNSQGMVRINIGYSERNMSCEIFQGEYDTYTNLSQVEFSTTSIPITSDNPLNDATIVSSWKQVKYDSRSADTKVAVSLLAVTCAVLLVVIIIMALRMRILMMNKNIGSRVSRGLDNAYIYQSIVGPIRRSDAHYTDMRWSNANEYNRVLSSTIVDNVPPLPPRDTGSSH